MGSKTMLLFISILELCFVMSGCGFLRNSHNVYMGFDKADYTIVAGAICPLTYQKRVDIIIRVVNREGNDRGARKKDSGLEKQH